jgi:hypothetical protein
MMHLNEHVLNLCTYLSLISTFVVIIIIYNCKLLNRPFTYLILYVTISDFLCALTLAVL